jgi:hypothetical protein
MESIWIILIALGSVGLLSFVSFLTYKIAKKNNISLEDVLDNIDQYVDIGTGIAIFVKNVVIDMGINKEDADKYAKLIIDTLEYIKVIDDKKEVKIAEGIAYALDKAELFGIDITDEREYIIKVIVKLGFNVYEAIFDSGVVVEDYNVIE